MLIGFANLLVGVPGQAFIEWGTFQKLRGSDEPGLAGGEAGRVHEDIPDHPGNAAV